MEINFGKTDMRYHSLIIVLFFSFTLNAALWHVEIIDEHNAKLELNRTVLTIKKCDGHNTLEIKYQGERTESIENIFYHSTIERLSTFSELHTLLNNLEFDAKFLNQDKEELYKFLGKIILGQSQTKPQSQEKSSKKKRFQFKQPHGKKSKQLVGSFPKKMEMIIKFFNDDECRQRCQTFNFSPLRNTLLYGLSGTGKTYTAEAMAEILGIPYLSIKIPEILDEHPSKAEKALKELFDTALEEARKNEKEYALIIFDEADALLTHRDASPKNPWYNSQTNTFLQLLSDQKYNNVIVILISNAPQLIDPAALRSGRIDNKIEFQLPNFQKRKALFIYYMQKYNGAFEELLQSEHALNSLAKNSSGLNVPDIKVLVDNAIQEFIFNQTPICLQKLKDEIELTKFRHNRITRSRL